jgi:membrane protease subunit (stomatin/prohibitin family)
MGTNNIVFLEVIEWFDDSGQELAHRIPQEGSGEIKWGAQLTVRESQAAVFFYNGKAVDALGPGRHTLKTMNIPILTKILSAPWGMTSPLRAEVYMANMKVFPNLKWGTRDPVAFRDSELGLIRLRAFGVFNIRVIQPVLFINSLVGTKASYGTEDLEEYLRRVIASRFNDFMGEQIDTIFNLPAKYDELSAGLKQLLQGDLAQFGLGLLDLYINSITPPPEVQKAIDDKSKLGVFDDLNKLLKMKAAMALESAAANQGEAGSALGMGMVFMMPHVADAFRPAELRLRGTARRPLSCPGCSQPSRRVPIFCSFCGQPLLLYKKCASCGGDIPPQGRFCRHAKAGRMKIPDEKWAPADGKPAGSSFCNACGERI